MPGHIGTSIAFNSGAAHGQDPKNLTDDQVARMRQRLMERGMPVDKASDEDLRMLAIRQAESFRDNAPTSAEQAAQHVLAADGLAEVLRVVHRRALRLLVERLHETGLGEALWCAQSRQQRPRGGHNEAHALGGEPMQRTRTRGRHLKMRGEAAIRIDFL